MVNLDEVKRQEFEEMRETFKDTMEDKRWDCYDQGNNKSFCRLGDTYVTLEFDKRDKQDR